MCAFLVLSSIKGTRKKQRMPLIKLRKQMQKCSSQSPKNLSPLTSRVLSECCPACMCQVGDDGG